MEVVVEELDLTGYGGGGIVISLTINAQARARSYLDCLTVEGREAALPLQVTGAQIEATKRISFSTSAAVDVDAIGEATLTLESDSNGAYATPVALAFDVSSASDRRAALVLTHPPLAGQTYTLVAAGLKGVCGQTQKEPAQFDRRMETMALSADSSVPTRAYGPTSMGWPLLRIPNTCAARGVTVNRWGGNAVLPFNCERSVGRI